MELDNKNSFGIGEGELIEIIYELPLPMRLDRWLVSKRPEQSRARIQPVSYTHLRAHET